MTIGEDFRWIDFSLFVVGVVEDEDDESSLDFDGDGGFLFKFNIDLGNNHNR